MTTKILKTTSTVRTVDKNHPKSFITNIPISIRDFLELNKKSKMIWDARLTSKGEKIVCIKLEDL